MDAPTRYVRQVEARLRHGEKVERLGGRFFEGDPLADAVVEALSAYPRAERDALIERCLKQGIAAVPEAPPAVRALFLELDRVPMWVDFERMERGLAAFFRAGILGGLVLGAYSLVAGYCSPAGNKPLAFSGRLEEDAPRRLAETSRFVEAVTASGGMRRFSEGFACTVKVRLVHASVRRMLNRSPKWQREHWGEPLNQVDMAGTILLFSHLLMSGLGRLGFHTTRAEREDYLHLWRYVAFVIGVADELRATNEVEADALWDLITATQEPPDADSRALALALLESPIRSAPTPEARRRAERMRPVGYTLSRFLLGDEIADRLGYPRTALPYALPMLAALGRGATRTLCRVPRAKRQMAEAGRRYWRDVVALSLAGVPATFPMPAALREPSSGA